MTVLTVIFFVLLAIWFTGLIIRAAAARWLSNRAEEYNRAARQAQKEAQKRARTGREGEVTIEATEATLAKKVSRGVGEYIEFEEVTITEENTETKQ